MRVVIFCHSLASCWNHGNAHFLRGTISDMLRRGWKVDVYEPSNGWSAANLIQEGGPGALHSYRTVYPQLSSSSYTLETLNLDRALNGADAVLVHEWNDPALVQMVGEHKRFGGNYTLLFHDTHHRSVTAPEEMARYDLSAYDGVLAFGRVVRNLYLEKGWAKQAWTWHEAADPNVFKPYPQIRKRGDLVWVGNWGDEERTAELHEFLLKPVKDLGLKATVYGVRYPAHAIRALQDAGISYAGWLPNYEAPEVFASYSMTVHVPRRPYAEALKGIPTIRVFEALACGIPMISAPWEDSEGLFNGERDFPMVANGEEMKSEMKWILDHPAEAQARSRHGLQTVLERHTCRHRVDELERILGSQVTSERGENRKAVLL